MKTSGKRAQEEITRSSHKSYAITSLTNGDSVQFLLEMASCICGTKVAEIHLVTGDKDLLERSYGLVLEERPLEQTFCSLVISNPSGALIVSDIAKDVRIRDHDMVQGGANHTFYAGTPMLLQDGTVLGVLSVKHPKPHNLDKKQLASLQSFAKQMVQILELGRLQLHMPHTDRLHNPKGDLSYSSPEPLELAEKREKLELEINAARFRSLVENGSDAIAILGVDGKASYVSPSITSILGYTEEEALNLNLFEVVHPDDIPQLKEKMAEALKNPGVPIKGHTSRTKHKNGSWRWLEATITNMLHDPSLNGIVDNFRDVTERVNVQSALKESEEKYRSIFNSSPLPKWIFERKSNRIVDVNHRAIEVYGYSREEFLGMDLFQLRPEQEIPKLLESQKLVRPQTGNINFGVFTHKKKNGDLIKVEVNGQQIQYNGKNCMMVVCLDVSDYIFKQHVEQLERALIERSIKQDAQLQKLLEEYIKGAEDLFPGMKGTILKIEKGRVRDFVAPSISPGFANSFNNFEIGPKNGSCGTAAFYGKPIIVSDIANDPLWEGYGELALKEGFRSCWSQPIFDSQGNVFATFANYYPTPRSPSDAEMEYFSRAASLLGLIMESDLKKNALSLSNERFEYVNKATYDAIYDWDIIKNLLDWGEGLQRIFGHDGMEKNSIEAWEKLVHPMDAQAVGESLHQFLKDPARERWYSEYRFQKADGTYAFIEEIGHVVRNGKGSPVRMIGVLRDVTARTLEEHQLRLMESVITNTTDAVLITQADDVDARGQKIIFANQAFTKMTGYSAAEVIGKSPKILQGQRTDAKEMESLKHSMRRGEAHELTVINYKKNREEFWIHMSISPVSDLQGNLTHWIAVERDVTVQKHQELEKQLLQDLGQYFNNEDALQTCLTKVTEHLTAFGNFGIAEIWLPNFEKSAIRRVALHAGNEVGNKFFKSSKKIKEFEYGIGLPGAVWKGKKMVIWDDLSNKEVFIRRDAAKKAGLRSALGLPLLHNKEVVGVLVLGTEQKKNQFTFYRELLKKLESFMGAEVNRKRLENELHKIFAFVPDVICLMDLQGNFRKINTVGSEILGYKEEELLSLPTTQLIYEDDKDLLTEALKEMGPGETVFHFENRYRTKKGEIVWLSWTCNTSIEEGLIYGVAKDTTENRELQELLQKSNELAKIGSWEVDLIRKSVFWSPITKQLHEVEQDYEPDLKSGIDFYKIGSSRKQLKEAVKNAIENGAPFDLELKLVTAKGNERWVRTMGQAEMANGTCIRLYGSFQDIHYRKDLELRLKRMANNLPGVLFQYHLHPDGSDKMLYVSKRSKEIWGMEPQVCMADNSMILKRIDETGDIDKLMESVATSASTMESWNQQWRYLHPNGEVRWHEGYGAPYKMADGTIVWDSLVLDITEKKELEELLRTTANMARIGSWNVDLTDHSIYWSPMTREILEVSEDYTPTLEEGLAIYEGESKQLIKAAVENLIAKGEDFDLELLLTTNKGNSKWVRSLGKSEMAHGKSIRIYGSFQDIHPRKIAELELKRAYRERNTILESIGDGFFTVDKKWTITYFNQQAENILQRKREEMLGKNLWEIYTDAVETDFYKQYHHAMDTGENVLFEDYYPTLDIWVEISIYPSDNGLSVYFKDIGVRKLAEQQIKLSNERFEKVTEATNDAIWDWDITNNTIHWGRGFHILFGYEMEKVVHGLYPWTAHIHPDDMEKVMASLKRIVEDPEAHNWMSEYRYLKKNGNYAYVVDRGLVIRDEKGQGLRMVGAMTDITHIKEHEESLKNLNEELERRAEELERSNSELEQFAFVASHDLQEPLRMVTSFLTLLERRYTDVLDETGKTYIDFASGGAKRMKQIILDLLEFSRVGKMMYDMEAIDLNKVLDDYQISRRKLISEKSANLVYQKLPTLHNYGPPIIQIFHNLLDNAIKYTPTGSIPKIEIGVDQTDSYWQFFIRDNGIGIKEEYYAKIFNIFQRLHNRDEYSGTGIGLAIVKKNVEGLGGKVWVESTLGEGTTFYFTVPK